MSKIGRKNKQERIKESIKICKEYGAKTLMHLFKDEHEKHQHLKKKKNWFTTIMKD